MEKFLLWICVFFVSVSASMAQDAAEVIAFKAEEFNGKVKLTWTIKAGGTCNGIGIQRRLDGTAFAEVGTLEGVCGNLSFPTNYEYTDLEPVLNRVNFYRLDLGGSGFSDTVSVEVIHLGKDNYVIFGNPLNETGTLYFRNDTSASVLVQFMSLDGKPEVEYRTNERSIILKRSDFGSSGLRIFRISSDASDTVVEGRILIN